MLNLNSKQKQEIIRQYKLLNNSVFSRREHKNDYSERDDFQRDYSRILYSPSFRRLQGKMQIMGINSAAFYRNRLTHSLEVSQIATSIASQLAESCEEEKMYGKDIFLIEAAALAHDIGHPAFGHKGERVLNNLTPDVNFEGNAQNFRVLRTLEKKDFGNNGLNLTMRTLLAINKYIIEEDRGLSKFMYHDDFKSLAEFRAEVNMENQRTLDAQIIELADDIAYTVHDLEDGLSLGILDVDEILFCLQNKGYNSKVLFENIVNEVRSKFQKKSPVGVYEDYSKIFRLALTSNLANKLVNDVTIGQVKDEFANKRGIDKINMELMLGTYTQLVTDLNDVIFECLNRSDSISLYELKGEKILKSLFAIYSDVSINKNGYFLPQEYRPNKKSDEKLYGIQLAQNSIDYLSGMMDSFAIAEYSRFFNEDFCDIKI